MTCDSIEYFIKSERISSLKRTSTHSRSILTALLNFGLGGEFVVPRSFKKIFLGSIASS